MFTITNVFGDQAVRQLGSRKLRQQGIGMIETLIATLVVAVGLVGILQLVQTNLRNSDSAYFKNQAAVLVSDMFDRLRSNSGSALSGDYDLAYNTATPAVGDEVDTDLNQWRTSVVTVLPQGASAVNCDGTSEICTVSIRWDDSRATSGNAQQEFLVRSRLR